MKNFSLKALGAFIFAAGLVVAGVSAPAYAATTASMTTTTFVANSTVSSSLTLSFSDNSAGSSTYAQIGLSNLLLPNTCSGTTTTLSTCGVSSITINGSAAPVGTTFTKVNSGNFQVTPPIGATISTMEIVFSANQLTVGSNAGSYNVTWQTVSGGSAVAQSAYTVTAPVYTLSFNANGGTGSMADQTGNGNVTVSSTTFTRSGYTFAGWVSSANGVNVVAQDGGTLYLSSTRTIYAKWTANSSGGGSSSGGSNSSETLANTGISSATGISLLAGGLSLALVGAEMFMIARRKRSN